MSKTNDLIKSHIDYISATKSLDNALSCEYESDEERLNAIRLAAEMLAKNEHELRENIEGVKDVFDYLDRKKELISELRYKLDKKEQSIDEYKKYASSELIAILKDVESRTGKKYIDSGGVKISYRKYGKGKVETNDNVIQKKYVKYNITIKELNLKELNSIITIVEDANYEYAVTEKLDKEAIRKDIESGIKIDGAHISDAVEKLEIKTSVEGLL